jgi:hypothetical protein
MAWYGGHNNALRLKLRFHPSAKPKKLRALVDIELYFSVDTLETRIAGLTVIYVERISKKDRNEAKRDKDPE